MATQYTAGLTSGQVLTAATMNSIGATWETWTPTISSSAGTITSGSLVRARYCRIQKLIVARFEYTIGTAGTAAGSYLDFTLPVTATTNWGGGCSMGFGREYNLTGWHLNVWLISTTSGRVGVYENSGVIQNSRFISAEVIYEAA